MSEIRGNCKLLRKPSPPSQLSLSGTIFPHKRHLGKASWCSQQHLLLCHHHQIFSSYLHNVRFCTMKYTVIELFYNVSFASSAQAGERMYISGRRRVNFDYWRQAVSFNITVTQYTHYTLYTLHITHITHNTHYTLHTLPSHTGDSTKQQSPCL